MSVPGGAAHPIVPEEATAFLMHDPVGNVELLTALRYDSDHHCLGVTRDGALVAVLVAAREEGDDALTARFAAVDDVALAPLIAACPMGVRRIVVHRAGMLPALEVAFRLAPEQRSERLFFAPPTLAVTPSPIVKPLTMGDAALVAASATQFGVMGLPDTLARGFRPFGVIAGNRLIAHAIAASTTEWTEEVMSVWTAAHHRGRGLATQIVATVTADILAHGRTAIYVASVTNRASQRVAEKVGFRFSHEMTAYHVRKR